MRNITKLVQEDCETTNGQMANVKSEGKQVASCKHSNLEKKSGTIERGCFHEHLGSYSMLWARQGKPRYWLIEVFCGLWT
jgi:hypothetical protein